MCSVCFGKTWVALRNMFSDMTFKEANMAGFEIFNLDFMRIIPFLVVQKFEHGVIIFQFHEG